MRSLFPWTEVSKAVQSLTVGQTVLEIPLSEGSKLELHRAFVFARFPYTSPYTHAFVRVCTCILPCIFIRVYISCTLYIQCTRRGFCTLVPSYYVQQVTRQQSNIISKIENACKHPTPKTTNTSKRQLIQQII